MDEANLTFECTVEVLPGILLDVTVEVESAGDKSAEGCGLQSGVYYSKG